MSDPVQVLLQYGYVVLFVFVLSEQIGLPIPAVPVLLGVGALSGAGRMSLVPAFAVALAASLPPDLFWFELGRRRGGRILGLICRVSLEPDSCVRRSQNLFLRWGRKTLLIAKFFPGLSTIAPPLAGVVGVGRSQFLLFDSVGLLVWAGAWIGLGYVFSDALELVASQAARLGNYALVIAGAALAAYVIFKYVQRRRFFRSLRIARITPEELKRRLDIPDADLVVIDTRAALDVTAAPYTIPGALWIAAEEMDQRRAELPRDREIVLYCT